MNEPRTRLDCLKMAALCLCGWALLPFALGGAVFNAVFGRTEQAFELVAISLMLAVSPFTYGWLAIVGPDFPRRKR